jgi:hypothetical protein
VQVKQAPVHMPNRKAEEVDEFDMFLKDKLVTSRREENVPLKSVACELKVDVAELNA